MQPTDLATLAWQGQVPLWRAFWINAILIPIGLGLLLDLAIWNDGLRWALGVVVGLPLLLWALVSLWRCAYNTEYRLLGHAARAFVILVLPGLLGVFLGQPAV